MAFTLEGGDVLPTASQLARQFSISLATLKRRLTAEGTSLSRLKAGAHRDLAETLLSDPHLSIAEVARRTRFSDAGAFRRAFRQWTGQSPSAWRNKTLG
jgi:AraC-like DNA-binding protein